MTPEAPWEGALRRLEGIMARVEALLGKREAPPTDAAIFRSHLAFRWERAGKGGGSSRSLTRTGWISRRSSESTGRRRSFSGTRTSLFPGGGRTTFSCGGAGDREVVVREGLLPVFGPRGLRIVELARWDLFSFPKIVGQLRDLPFRFLLYCDDLSFDEGEATTGGSRRCWTAGSRSARRTC